MKGNAKTVVRIQTRRPWTFSKRTPSVPPCLSHTRHTHDIHTHFIFSFGRIHFTTWKAISEHFQPWSILLTSERSPRYNHTSRTTDARMKTHASKTNLKFHTWLAFRKSSCHKFSKTNINRHLGLHHISKARNITVHLYRKSVWRATDNARKIAERSWNPLALIFF